VPCSTHYNDGSSDTEGSEDVPDDHHDEHGALVLDRDTLSNRDVPQRDEQEEQTTSVDYHDSLALGGLPLVPVVLELPDKLSWGSAVEVSSNYLATSV